MSRLYSFALKYYYNLTSWEWASIKQGCWMTNYMKYSNEQLIKCPLLRYIHPNSFCWRIFILPENKPFFFQTEFAIGQWHIIFIWVTNQNSSSKYFRLMRYRPFSHCIDQAGLGAFTAKSGRKHYNPPSIDRHVNELWLSQFS